MERISRQVRSLVVVVMVCRSFFPFFLSPAGSGISLSSLYSSLVIDNRSFLSGCSDMNCRIPSEIVKDPPFFHISP